MLAKLSSRFVSWLMHFSERDTEAWLAFYINDGQTEAHPETGEQVPVKFPVYARFRPGLVPKAGKVYNVDFCSRPAERFVRDGQVVRQRRKLELRFQEPENLDPERQVLVMDLATCPKGQDIILLPENRDNLRRTRMGGSNASRLVLWTASEGESVGVKVIDAPSDIIADTPARIELTAAVPTVKKAAEVEEASQTKGGNTTLWSRFEIRAANERGDKGMPVVLYDHRRQGSHLPAGQVELVRGFHGPHINVYDLEMAKPQRAGITALLSDHVFEGDEQIAVEGAPIAEAWSWVEGCRVCVILTDDKHQVTFKTSGGRVIVVGSEITRMRLEEASRPTVIGSSDPASLCIGLPEDEEGNDDVKDDADGWDDEPVGVPGVTWASDPEDTFEEEAEQSAESFEEGPDDRW